MITNEKDDYYVAPEKEKKKKQVDGDYQEPEYITITITNPITHERTFSRLISNPSLLPFLIALSSCWQENTHHLSDQYHGLSNSIAILANNLP